MKDIISDDPITKEEIQTSSICNSIIIKADNIKESTNKIMIDNIPIKVNFEK